MKDRKKPRTCGEMMKQLRERWPEVYTIAELSEKSGISRGTMQYWDEHPKSPLAKPGRRHWDRIFGVPQDSAVPAGIGHPGVVHSPAASQTTMTREEAMMFTKFMAQQTELMGRMLDRLDRMEEREGKADGDQAGRSTGTTG